MRRWRNARAPAQRGHVEVIVRIDAGRTTRVCLDEPWKVPVGTPRRVVARGMPTQLTRRQAPSPDNARYPLVRPLHLCIRRGASADAQRFYRWATSPDGQRVLKRRFAPMNRQKRSTQVTSR